MYISCPSCSTSFDVDGAVIGSGGRAVRCYNCNHTWHQYPVVHQPQAHFVPVQYVPPTQFAMPPQAMVPQPQQAAPAAPPPMPEPEPFPEPDPEPVFEPEPEPEPLPEPEPIPEEDLPSDDELNAMLGDPDEIEDSSSFAEESREDLTEIDEDAIHELEDPEPLDMIHSDGGDGIEEEEIDPDDIPDPEPLPGALYEQDGYEGDDEEMAPQGSLIKTLIKLVIIFVVIGGLGAGAIFARGIVVDLIPSTNIVYELIGLKVPIPGEGLKINAGGPQRVERNGKEVIQIKGSIANVSDVNQQVPEIIIRAIDAENQVVQIQTLKPAKTMLEPGKSIKFTGIFENLVPTARRLDVIYGSFITDEGGEAMHKDDAKK